MKSPTLSFLTKSLLACGPVVSPPGSACAQPFHVLHAFTDGLDGANPLGGLMQDSAGNLYGTTIQGGADIDGNVFQIAPDGTQTTLYSFAGGTDGRKPEAGVIADAAGNLYGTTYYGGAGCDCGTVFKLAPTGTETVLHAFNGRDGANPYAGLVIDRNNNLYGTTVSGGTEDNGVIYKVTPNGREKLLHTFSGGTDGAIPYAGLILYRGNLYGTAIIGGAHNSGVVFELNPKGAFKVIHAFTGGRNAAYPEGGVIADNQGNLYGTTRGGGDGFGTVYKLSPAGTETVLHKFNGATDGSQPYAGLAADAAGNLYGATVAGGAQQGYGTIFKVAADGTFSRLHTFTDGADGAYPEGGVIAGGKKVFGVAYAGGAKLWGTVFEIPQ